MFTLRHIGNAVVAAGVAALFLGGPLLISGCGGGGTPAPVTPGASRFSGNWEGPWASAPRGENGFVKLVVASDGSFQGISWSAQTSSNGSIKGRIEGDGRFTGTSTMSMARDVPISGTFTLGSAGDSLNADFSQTIDGNAYASTFNLRQPAALPRPSR